MSSVFRKTGGKLGVPKKNKTNPKNTEKLFDSSGLRGFLEGG